MSETSKQVKQSDGKLQLKLLRTKQPLGSVQVPWRIEPDNNDSVYYDITGLYAYYLVLSVVIVGFNIILKV